MPLRLRHVLAVLAEEVRDLETRITQLERELAVFATHDPVTQRLLEIPGVGLLTATALVATVGHIHAFRRARHFAPSWPGEHRSPRRGRTYERTGYSEGYERSLA